MEPQLKRSTYVVPSALNAAICELDELALLPPNWDGLGALAIETDVIAIARKFMRAFSKNLAYRPRVIPMSSGNLQLAWHRELKTLALEFVSPHSIRFLPGYPAAGVDTEAAFPAADVDRAVDVIRRFMNSRSSASIAFRETCKAGSI